MRVAFVANNYLDPGNPGSWSGLPFFMRRALEDAGVVVEPCMVDDPGRVLALARYAFWRFAKGRRYLMGCERRLLMRYAAQARRRLGEMRPDAAFCPSSWPVAYLDSPVPVVFWTDACFAGMVDFYESFSNLVPVSLADGHAAERSALRRCAHAIYSSEWAAAMARDVYSADSSKVSVVPFGANVVERPSISEVETIVASREKGVVRLLLVGVDWHRKGADKAVGAVAWLNSHGVRARLTVLGCWPPRGQAVPPEVEVIPFVSKASPEGWARFSELCRGSHFMIMPSRADCTPVAIAEANAFGLPCLAPAIGGIGSLIRNGVNGQLFAGSAEAADYGQAVQAVVRDPARYAALAVGSAAHAERNLSWRVSGAKVAEILAGAVLGPRRGRAKEGVPMTSAR